VEEGLEIHPGKTTLITFLSREDVGNEIVLVEEPMGPKDVKNIKDRKLTVVRDNRLCMHQNRRDNARHQGTDGSRGGKREPLFHPFVQGRGKGRASERQRHQEMMGVRKQEVMNPWR